MKIIITRYTQEYTQDEDLIPSVLEFQGTIDSLDTDGFITIEKDNGDLVFIDKDDVATIEAVPSSKKDDRKAEPGEDSVPDAMAELKDTLEEAFGPGVKVEVFSNVSKAERPPTPAEAWHTIIQYLDEDCSYEGSEYYQAWDCLDNYFKD